ncbi:MAG TPA: TonB-dependent receptor [Chitinophagaceae bacterium]|nr:TonB-dependent receptor [Chitinophagaceae bacterium]
MKEYILTGIVIFAMNIANSQKITISGYVKDRLSREALIGASIINANNKTGTSTNQYGFFSLTTNAADTVELIISYQGYKLQAKKITAGKNLRLNVLLESSAGDLSEVVISSFHNNRNVEKPQMSVIDVPIKAIKNFPVLMGERDVLKVIQLLPGVQAGQEGTAGFYVRGGNLDQNLVQLDEATIYNPNHLFGLFSTFNVNSINHVQLIKGGFPAEYGGRLSSILNITMKEGNKTKYQAEGGIGILSTNLTFQGPIKKNKSSFIVSARKSYINLLLQPATSKSTRYSFYDLTAKMNYELGEKDHIFLSFFKGNDNAGYTGASSLNYKTDFGNTTGTLRWNHLFGNKIFSNTSLIYNDYHLGLGSTQNNYYEVLYTGIRDLNIKTDFTFTPNIKHKIKAGVTYTYHTLYPASVSSKVPLSGNQIIINKDSVASRLANELAFYLNDEYDISKIISLNYGVRIPYFSGGGASYSGIEPRITTKVSLNPTTSLKASWTLMNQFLHSVPNSTASLPTDIWLSSSQFIKPQKSTQIALGLFKNFKENGIEASVEVYYKTMDNQVLFKEGSQIVLNTNLDSILTFGKGKSYGVELFVKKNVGRLTGWVSYTLSRTTQQFPQLNRGAQFPASFDRRHNFSLAGSYELNKHWTISADFVFYTGRAFTLPAGRITVPVNGSLYDGVYYDYFSRINARLRSYHRLDVSFSNKKTLKLWGRKYEREWIFGAYNLYSRLNPYFVYLTTNPDTKQPEARQVSLLPFIPSVSFNFKF